MCFVSFVSLYYKHIKKIMSKWLNWKPKKQRELESNIGLLHLLKPQKKRQKKTKPSSASPSSKFGTLRKVYTIGIAPQDLLNAIRAKENTYFGLHPDGATHTTKERFAMLSETLGEALDTGLSFEFLCEHKKERKELLLTVATMLPNKWNIRVQGMYLKVVPPQGVSREEL